MPSSKSAAKIGAFVFALLLYVVVAAVLEGARLPAAFRAAPVRISHRSASSLAPVAWSSARERLAIFDSVVHTIADLDVIAPGPFGDWYDELPALRDEAALAPDLQAMETAIRHLQNSLHDGHLHYRPASPQTEIRLPISFDVEWQHETPTFYISQADVGSGLHEGDRLVSYDGIPQDQLVHHFRNESPQNSLRTIGRDVAVYLARRRVDARRPLDRPSTSIEVSSREGEVAHSASLAWQADQSLNRATGLSGHSCAELVDRDYGGYRLASQGQHWCLYLPEATHGRGYPIVRLFTFLFAPGGRGETASADSARLRARDDLAALHRALHVIGKLDGVLLDLRDNRGGNDPYFFLDPWVSRPFSVATFQRKLSPRFLDGTLHAETESGGPSDSAYRELLSRFPGLELSEPEPFSCAPPSCDHATGTYTPALPSHDPTALLLGPECASACHAFATVFDEEDVGPLVGEPTAATSAVWRLRLPVPPVDGHELGSFSIDASRTLQGVSHSVVGATALHLDAPLERTFENRARYDAMLVDAAIVAVKAWPAAAAQRDIR